MQSHETLEKIELFRSLDAKERAALEGRCVWRHVQAKEWLVEHNDVGTDIYFLSHGAVRVLISPSPVRDVVLGVSHRNIFLGIEPRHVGLQELLSGIMDQTDDVTLFVNSD